MWAECVESRRTATSEGERLHEEKKEALMGLRASRCWHVGCSREGEREGHSGALHCHRLLIVMLCAL